MNFHKIRLLLGALVIGLLAACSSTPTPNIGGVSEREYLALGENRLAHEAAQEQRAAVLADGRARAYQRGEAITVGNDNLTYTSQWIREGNMIAITVVSASSNFGILSQGTMTIAAQPDGRPVLNPHGLPVVLTSSTGHMEANGRFFAGGVMNILAGAANGAIAAQIHADARCRTNCGDPVIVNTQAISGSEATATGTGTATTTGGGWGSMH